jgi:hypothetical protein
MGMPRNIRIFQVLMYVSIVLGVFLRFVSGEVDSPVLVVAVAINTLILVGFVVLITLYRKNWSRWAFAILFVLQFITSIPTIVELLHVPLGIIALSPVILRGIALVFVFTGDANRWFEHGLRPIR